MNPFATLVRREFWEHRSLWIAPLVTAGCLVVITIVGTIIANDRTPFDTNAWSRMNTQGGGMMSIGAFSLASQIFGISCIAGLVYLLDCLFAERKDRSILFWKSLPVSDAHTVLSKFAVAMLILPAGVYLLSAFTHLLVSGLLAVAWPQFFESAGGWSLLEWLRVQGWLLAVVAVSVLWFAPAAAWLMLASVLARRSPWLIVGLPVVALGLGESILLGSRHMWRFFGRRALPILNPGEALLWPGLWLGLVAAAGMLYVVIRLRRYRDDT